MMPPNYPLSAMYIHDTIPGGRRETKGKREKKKKKKL
jgi:hypothetical protein